MWKKYLFSKMILYTNLAHLKDTYVKRTLNYIKMGILQHQKGRYATFCYTLYMETISTRTNNQLTCCFTDGHFTSFEHTCDVSVTSLEVYRNITVMLPTKRRPFCT